MTTPTKEQSATVKADARKIHEQLLAEGIIEIPNAARIEPVTATTAAPVAVTPEPPVEPELTGVQRAIRFNQRLHAGERVETSAFKPTGLTGLARAQAANIKLQTERSKK
ncbi:MAG: hypothetical protein QOG67_2538 [Verrucomicrobiota bacterium]|jgi:hypothetical protein